MESASPSAQGGKGRKLGLVEIRLADEPWAPVAQGHTGAEVVRSVRVALRGTNVHRHRVAARKRSNGVNAESATSVHDIGTPVMGIGLWGLSPLCEIGISRRSVYQMTTSREQARGEGNCGRATNRGKEACEWLGKRRVCRQPSERHSLLECTPGSKLSRRLKARNRPAQAGLGNVEVSRGRSTGYPSPMDSRKG